MNITIKEISMENFKSYADKTFSFDDGLNVISGRNASGKTTIKNAFLWCLLGQDEDAKKDGGGIRTVGAPIESSPSVIVTLNVDGVDTTFARKLEATFTGKGENRVYKADSTACSIDSIPVTVSEFSARLKEIFPIDPAIWIDLYAFCDDKRISADERREILVSNFSTVTDEEVLSANEPYFAELRDAILTKGVDVVKAQNKEIEKNCTAALGRGKTVGTLQARIDEAQKAIVGGIDAKKEAEECARINAEISNLLNAADEAAEKELKDKIKGINDEIDAISAAENAKIDEVYSRQLKAWRDQQKSVKDQLSEAATRRKKVDYEYGSKALDYDNSCNDLLVAENDLMVLLADDYKPTTVCPTCGQKIPKKMLDEAAANYYEQRALKQEKVEARIQELKSNIASLETSINETREELDKLDETISKLEKIMSEQFSDPPTRPLPSEETTDKIDELLARREELVMSQAKSDEKYRREKADALTAELKQHQSNLATASLNGKQMARIKELQAEQGRINAMLLDAQRMIALCDEFTLAKASLIEDEIASHFNGLRFVLFDRYKNGEIKNACKIFVGDREYRILSFSQKILASASIIDGLSDHFNFYAPLMIDNASEIDTDSMYALSNTNRQTILIKVDDNPLTVYSI